MERVGLNCCIIPSRSDTELLYKKLSHQLKFFIGKRVSDPMSVEDILHDVFMKIHNNIGTLSNPAKAESWVFQITRNAIIDHYRQNKIPIELEDKIVPVFDSHEEDRHKNASEDLIAFIEELPEIYKEAIILTEYQGLTQKQLAEKMNISLTGAKSRVQRAKKMLKDNLLNCCHFEYDTYGTVIDYRKACCCCSSKEKK